jgi:hypothetical protein
MSNPDYAAFHALLEDAPARPVRRDPEAVRGLGRLEVPLSRTGARPSDVLALLDEVVGPATMASAGPARPNRDADQRLILGDDRRGRRPERRSDDPHRARPPWLGCAARWQRALVANCSSRFLVTALRSYHDPNDTCSPPQGTRSTVDVERFAFIDSRMAGVIMGGSSKLSLTSGEVSGAPIGVELESSVSDTLMQTDVSDRTTLVEPHLRRNPSARLIVLGSL